MAKFDVVFKKTENNDTDVIVHVNDNKGTWLHTRIYAHTTEKEMRHSLVAFSRDVCKRTNLDLAEVQAELLK